MLSKGIQIHLASAIFIAGIAATPMVSGSELKPSFPDLPQAITSFGAVQSGGYVYVYGGHAGKAHSYSVDTTLPDFRRISLKSPTHWETLASGPRIQGTSLVTYKQHIYRIGGLTVLNKETAVIEEDENENNTDTNLRSLDDFARFNLDSKAWEALPPMPAPRSSHDSVVVGHHLFVVGGWQLDGITDEASWCETMYVTDLSDETLSWSELPQPFKRRAVAAAALDGHIYVIGGMDSEGDTSNKVNIYDPVDKTWTTGPSLPNGPMKGFGAAACSQESRLLVSHYAGDLLALTSDSSSWQEVGTLNPRRFFHRMVPTGHRTVLVIGGANRSDGHLASLEVLNWVTP